MAKKYKLLKKFDSPSLEIWEGIIKTEDEWQKVLPNMEGHRLSKYPEWFEEVVEKEFVWTDELVKEFVTNPEAWGVSINAALYNFKWNHDKPSPQPTTNDVLKKEAIKRWINFMPDGIDPRESRSQTTTIQNENTPHTFTGDGKERITVTVDNYIGETIVVRPNKDKWRLIPEDQINALKKAIEKIINND